VDSTFDLGGKEEFHGVWTASLFVGLQLEDGNMRERRKGFQERKKLKN
jgi:hypothetical protein